MERVCQTIRNRRCCAGVCGGGRGCGKDGGGGGRIGKEVLWYEVRMGKVARSVTSRIQDDIK